MVDLNGHEAGNGGYSQRKPTAHRDSSTRKVRGRESVEPSRGGCLVRLLCVHDCCNQARALIELAASSPNPVAGRADFLLCQVLLMGLLRNRAMVSGWATLHKIGGSPRAISSASATTSFPIHLIAVSIAPA